MRQVLTTKNGRYHRHRRAQLVTFAASAAGMLV